MVKKRDAPGFLARFVPFFCTLWDKRLVKAIASRACRVSTDKLVFCVPFYESWRECFAEIREGNESFI